MRRLRFTVDITTHDPYDRDSYKRLAAVLEDAIESTVSNRARLTFYLGNVHVLRRQPRKEVYAALENYGVDEGLRDTIMDMLGRWKMEKEEAKCTDTG